MNKWRTLAVGVAACAILVSGAWVMGGVMAQSTPEPGSPGDPLVTESWVVQFVEEKVGARELEVVDVEAGQRLLGGAGTELILRAGQATVIDSELGGLADVTAGEDLGMDVSVPRNHLLIVPRSDGRGMEATTDIIVMVRGSYEIE